MEDDDEVLISSGIPSNEIEQPRGTIETDFEIGIHPSSSFKLSSEIINNPTPIDEEEDFELSEDNLPVPSFSVNTPNILDTSVAFDKANLNSLDADENYLVFDRTVVQSSREDNELMELP
mmetsp:Transcript_2527/g.3907  ORF Transcript_2527/g.3907 Transcript_2527/m.3907 type:complete len:120 (+) Transcript_2527:1505-1864(+)